MSPVSSPVEGSAAGGGGGGGGASVEGWAWGGCEGEWYNGYILHSGTPLFQTPELRTPL